MRQTLFFSTNSPLSLLCYDLPLISVKLLRIDARRQKGGKLRDKCLIVLRFYNL